jgi:hypothetical protein
MSRHNHNADMQVWHLIQQQGLDAKNVVALRKPPTIAAEWDGQGQGLLPPPITSHCNPPKSRGATQGHVHMFHGLAPVWPSPELSAGTHLGLFCTAALRFCLGSWAQ